MSVAWHSEETGGGGEKAATAPGGVSLNFSRVPYGRLYLGGRRPTKGLRRPNRGKRGEPLVPIDCQRDSQTGVPPGGTRGRSCILFGFGQRFDGQRLKKPYGRRAGPRGRSLWPPPSLNPFLLLFALSGYIYILSNVMAFCLWRLFCSNQKALFIFGLE